VTGRQLTFEDAARARDSAMERVDGAADPVWRADAEAAVLAVAARGMPFTTDDVWDAGLRYPRELRAIGPVMQRLARAGAIRRTGRFRPSLRSHLSPKPEWRRP